MGTPLFLRETRGVKFAESGTLLPDEARGILDQMERTKGVVKPAPAGRHDEFLWAWPARPHRLVPGLVLAYLPRALSPDRRFRLVP
jgi:DNA-binding transcriptional LysR family regulator